MPASAGISLPPASAGGYALFFSCSDPARFSAASRRASARLLDSLQGGLNFSLTDNPTEELRCPLQRASPCPRLQPVGHGLFFSSDPARFSAASRLASARLLDSLQRGLNLSLTDNPTEELPCPLQRASPCPRLQPVGYGLFFSSSDPARFSAASRRASARSQLLSHGQSY